MRSGLARRLTWAKKVLDAQVNFSLGYEDGDGDRVSCTGRKEQHKM